MTNRKGKPQKIDWDKVDGETLIGIPEIAQITGYHPGTLYNKRSDGTMPPPDAEGDNTVRWKLATIREWKLAIAERRRRRRGSPPPLQ